MSAATLLAQAFGEGACLYETVLTVPKDASPSQLRKAYYKKALQYHPDKIPNSASVEEKETAKAKFQAVSVAYTILSDPEKRAEYDESGELYETGDDLSENKSGVDQWTDYFKNIFPTVTTADIDAFEVKYKCSDEEESDVLKYYKQFKGDLNKMLECVMLSSDVDKERWVKDYIEPAVERGNVPDFLRKVRTTLENAPSKKRKINGAGKSKKVDKEDLSEESESESSEAVVAEVVEAATDLERKKKDASRSKQRDGRSTGMKSNGLESNKDYAKKKASNTKASAPDKKVKMGKEKSSEEDLIAQIRGNALARQSRESGFNSLMAGLEERYGGTASKNKKNGTKGKKVEDIPDDEFERIQAKLMKNRRKK
mmetsp:Transcript_12123/g.24926  ORF Transcript_12123/g.24926 Transcript_12123/m.24926 type:complete len:370 (-) Transcript_12123:148-1257(-)